MIDYVERLRLWEKFSLFHSKPEQKWRFSIHDGQIADVSVPRLELKHTAVCSFVFLAQLNCALVQKHSDFSLTHKPFHIKILQVKLLQPKCKCSHYNCFTNSNSRTVTHRHNWFETHSRSWYIKKKKRFPVGRSHHTAHLIQRKTVSNLKRVCFNSGLIWRKWVAVWICDRNTTATANKRTITAGSVLERPSQELT